VEALRERFGKYHVLEKLAQGGMAEVYKVKTIGIAGFEKIQALKRILPHSAREGRFIRSFIDEARIAVELTHRNIVQVFDFGKADGELFLAMELIEGRDLRTATTQAVSRDLPCPIPVAAYIIAEVAGGLDYAHRKTDLYGTALNIVHCDVSPSNVMLSTDGYVKILDFGIARATFASALERRRLRGKPRYMAPEQTLGEAPTSAADVFALGIIAWELFTGLPLYRGPDLKAILEAVRRTVPPRIDRLNPDVPKEIVDAIQKALSPKPDDRGTTADLLVACARTSMQGGAHALGAWLTAIDEATGSLSALPSIQTNSLSVQRASTSVPSQASSGVREATQSLMAAVPIAPGVAQPEPGDFGEGTPGFEDRPSTTNLIAKFDEPPARTSTGSPFAGFEHDGTTTSASKPWGRAPTTHPTAQRFGDRDPTQSTAQRSKLLEPTSTSATAQAMRWGHESTSAGGGRLVDVLPEREQTVSLPLPADEKFVERPSYATLVMGPGASPASMRFDDDEATQHVSSPMAEMLPHDETSFDDLIVEGEADQGELAVAVDEPVLIDDDLGVLATGAPIERRRTVVVVGVLSGAPTETLRPITRSLGELAYQRGGVVLALEPEALVVAFGLEVAGEDDVAVAMGWALDSAAMAKERHTGDTGTPQLRIGARTNVASTTTPEGAAKIPPDAIEEARALAREATPDRPWFVGVAGRVTSDLYTLRELPQQARTRSSRRVIEVVGPRRFEERDRARLERRGKFVGRGAQLDELVRWFDRALADDRRYGVLIVGAAGTGKSRLVAELIARLAASVEGTRTILTAANPATRHSPFALLIDHYQASLGVAPARGRAARAWFLQHLLHVLKEKRVPDDRAREVVTDLDRAMELRDGVGVGAPEVADLRPRIAAGLAVFREAMTDPQRPRLTVIEDVHLGDGPSLEVLRHTLAMPTKGPELLILTARPEGAAPPTVDAMVEVGDLIGAELRALIADRLGDASTPLNIAAVIARGGGNPLFVEELAQAVREGAADDSEIPASARDVVAARVDRLTPRAKAALRLASVMGGTVRARIVDELLGEDKTDDAHPVSALEELVEAGVLARPESSGHSTEGEFVFARGLVREVIYEGLPRRAQREYHARVGRLLAGRFFAGREEPPATIAEHLENGGDVAAAAAFWLRAGRLAMTASDADAAVVHFTRTLMLDHQLGDEPPTATSRTRRREALAGRELANRLRGDLTSDAGDLDELQRMCKGDPRRLADVAIRRAHRLLRTGDYAGAQVATVVAEDLGRAAGDARHVGEALRVRGEILERLGRFEEALHVVEKSRGVFAKAGAAAEEMQAMVGRGRIHLMRAHYEAAREAYKPVISRIDKAGDPWLERVVQNHVAIIEMCLGNYQVAMQSAQRSLELCRRYGDRAREGDALSVAGIIYLEVGLYDAAAGTFDKALELLARAGSRWSRADCLIYAGICDVRRGKDGLAVLDEAIAEASAIGARYLEANALISRAGVQLQLGALAEAAADATRGVAVARAATLVGYEIQGLARQAVAMTRARGKAALGEAGDLVHRALVLFDQQRHLEGSEEEVYVNCLEVLKLAGANDRAATVRARGKAEVQRKLAALDDPEWRTAYAARPECKALLGS
jgi:serine/threonine protein kinase/tetratricopeptide (TPR) repeat protein